MNDNQLHTDHVSNNQSSTSDRKILLYPVIFAVVLLVPVLAAALVVFDPGDECVCDCTNVLPAAAHTHGAGLVTAIKNDMQLVFNVSPAAQLYQVVDGQLELCGGDIEDRAMKHVTVDVKDARFALGDRLPVEVAIEIRAADDNRVIVQAGAPAMVAQGHGYHFGDNFRVPNDASYAWTVTISPVQALRQAGAAAVWQEPVSWSGTFTVAADGTVTGQATPPQLVGQATEQGLHITLSVEKPQPLYRVVDGESLPVEANAPEAGTRYFVVEVTDHSVNYEEKLPGAAVTVIFTQGDSQHIQQFDPVISPVYGLHYGANVALEPGEWTITVEVDGLDFMRHAGAAVSLGRNPVVSTFVYTVAPR